MSASQVKLLEGKVLAKEIREQIKIEVEGFTAKGMETPRLVALRVADDAASDWYLDQQAKWAEKLGMRFERVDVQPAAEANLRDKIKRVNADGDCHGVFVTMPLPKGIDPDILLELDPKKDVEGVHPANLGLIVLRRAKLVPSTALAAFRLIESTGANLRGMNAVIIGQSAIVGRPLNLLLGEKRVTTTVCNTGTSAELLEKSVRAAQIVIACAGQPGMVKGDWIRSGAIVIDVGTTEVDGKLVGDVEFAAASERADYITPVPGGVGPLTVTMLMQNLVTAYKWQKSL